MMRRYDAVGLFLLVLAIAVSVAADQAPDRHVLWHQQPAAEWTEALPAVWSDGLVRGLRARDGIEVDMGWEGRALEEATLRATTDEPCRLRTNDAVTTRTSEGHPF